MLMIPFPFRIRRYHFWCALSHREVEVEFEEVGLPGFWREVAVKRCSAFDPPTAVSCRRCCLDPTYRHLWETSRAGQGEEPAGVPDHD